MTALQTVAEIARYLPSPPAIAIKILDAIQGDEASFDQLADIVAADPALTAQILRIANSSLYGLPKQVESLAQATGLLGTRALKNIALSFVIVKNFEQVPEGGFDLDFFWRHSITTAVAAEVLKTAVRHQASDIFVAALLQDIGILVLCLNDPTTVARLFDEKRARDCGYWEAEVGHYGYSHAEIGYHLLTSWNLPPSICEPIRAHHGAHEDDEHGETARLLSLAEAIASLYHGSKGSLRLKEVHLALIDGYGMSKEQVEALIDQVGLKSKETMDAFAIPPGDLKPFSQIMQEANDELRRLNFSYEELVFELRQAKHNVEKLASELKKTNDRLRQLVFRDELTNLYNHRYFQEILESELVRVTRYHHPLALLLVDIDFFKKVNDGYGHLVGDEVLKHVARAMCALVRECDIVARYGGEEFAIILPETNTTRAKIVGQRIRRGIEQTRIPHAGTFMSVTVSIGGASTDMAAVGSDKTTLIAHSDDMLYRAKRNGRNRVEFSSTRLAPSL